MFSTGSPEPLAVLAEPAINTYLLSKEMRRVCVHGRLIEVPKNDGSMWAYVIKGELRLEPLDG